MIAIQFSIIFEENISISRLSCQSWRRMKFENLLFAEVLLKKRQMEINWLPRISLSVHISTTYRYVSTYISKRCRKTRDRFTGKIGLIQIFVHSFFYAGKKESQINFSQHSARRQQIFLANPQHMFRGRANFLFIYFTEDSICTWTQICHDNSIYSARHLIL